MTQRDIVVIGASAGGIQALTTLVAGLPRDFPASLLIVVHIPPYAISRLPEILSRSGPLPATHAQQGEAIEPGRIYVAPPDRHLLVRTGWIELSRGPRENHARPAIDRIVSHCRPGLRSDETIGIVLSGALYDGSMGLLAIKTRGGMAIVQDPKEAIVDSMPRRAIERVAADHILPVAEIAAALTDLVRQPVMSARRDQQVNTIDAEERLEAVIAEDFAEQASDGRTEETTLFTCPDCGGVLWQGGEGPVLRFRCHVGHAFAPEVLLSQKSEELETALWSSLRLLKEKATLTQQLANRTRTSGNGKAAQAAERIAEQAKLDERHAQVIQELLEAMPSPMDQAAVVTHAMNDGCNRWPARSAPGRWGCGRPQKGAGEARHARRKTPVLPS